MSIAVVTIEENNEYHTTAVTGSHEPGLARMKVQHRNPNPLTFALFFDYSPGPGADRWRIDKSGILPVTSGIWSVVEERPVPLWTAGACVPGLVGVVTVRTYDGRVLMRMTPRPLGGYWAEWPSHPFNTEWCYGTGNKGGGEKVTDIALKGEGYFRWRRTGGVL